VVAPVNPWADQPMEPAGPFPDVPPGKPVRAAFHATAAAAFRPRDQVPGEGGLVDLHLGRPRDTLVHMKLLATLLLSAALSFGADISGKWTATVVLDAGSGSPTFEFKQAGETLTGMYHGQFGDAPLTGTVKGDKVEFTFGTDAAKAKYSGTLDGAAKMKGTVDYGAEAGKGTFTATKD